MSFLLCSEELVHSLLLDNLVQAGDPGFSVLLAGRTHPVHLVVAHHHCPALIEFAALHRVLVADVAVIEDLELPGSLTSFFFFYCPYSDVIQRYDA